MIDKNRLFDPDVDRTPLLRLMRRPAADKLFVILFTARSGSSWLTDIARASGRLSYPDECFNPGFLPTMSRALSSATMADYIAALTRRRNTHGVYGCQLTYHHLRAAFRDEDEFLSYFRNAAFFWLMREDFVLQAVSLYKMVATSIGHAVQADAETRAAAEAAFGYDGDSIAHWMNHNLVAERATAAMIARHSLTPLRMSYEDITAAGTLATVNLMAHHIGIQPITVERIDSAHVKLATDRNAEFAARFRKENAELVALVEAERAPWLADLQRIAD